MDTVAATPAQNTEINKGPRDKPAAATKPEPTKRKTNKNGLVTVRYLGNRFTPMKYEVWANGGMVKLAFGASSATAQVTPEVADVLTGKTKAKYDENERPVSAVIALGNISKEASANERFEEVQ